MAGQVISAHRAQMQRALQRPTAVGGSRRQKPAARCCLGWIGRRSRTGGRRLWELAGCRFGRAVRVPRFAAWGGVQETGRGETGGGRRGRRHGGGQEHDHDLGSRPWVATRRRVQHGADDIGIDGGATRGDPPHCADQLVGLRDPLLQEVSDPYVVACEQLSVRP